MEPIQRPRDALDFVEELAAERGAIAMVDEDYYQAFLNLNQHQIEKLAITLMLDHEREVRRLSGGKTDPDAVERVAKLVQNICVAISIGVARFDAFGRLGLVARIGFEPELNTNEALDRRHEEIAPVIINIVRRTLPWILSREITQAQLPL